jgi:hypothetical protein
MAQAKTTPPDYNALYDKLLAQLGGPVEVETPGLGRCAFPRPAEVYSAMNYVRMAQAQAAGLATAGVFVVGYRRGLEPTGEEQ